MCLVAEAMLAGKGCQTLAFVYWVYILLFFILIFAG